VFAFGSLGAGHGTALPLLVFAARLSLVPAAGFFAAPFWWAGVGWVLKHGNRWLSLGVMGVHTAAVWLVVQYGSGRESVTEQWHYFWQFERLAPLWLWSGIGVHLAGCLAGWLLAIVVGSSDQASCVG
jgi:hypothetical protein